jgi:hypothetical protein
LAIEAIDDGALVLYGRCDEGVGAPFQPFANALEHFVERHTPASAISADSPANSAASFPTSSIASAACRA